MKKVLGLLGLANKANHVAIGTNNVVAAIRKNKALLILVAEDASQNTKKQLSDKSKYYNINLINIRVSKSNLGRACGKSETSAVGITDKNFAEALAAAIKTLETQSIS